MSGQTCHEEIADPITGGAEPCGIKAVGWRIDPEENQPYPVCTLHHRWPYADEWVEAAALLRRVRAAAEPLALSEWEAQYGLTVASVSRYILTVLSPGTPAGARLRAALDGRQPT